MFVFGYVKDGEEEQFLLLRLPSSQKQRDYFVTWERRRMGAHVCPRQDETMDVLFLLFQLPIEETTLGEMIRIACWESFQRGQSGESLSEDQQRFSFSLPENPVITYTLGQLLRFSSMRDDVSPANYEWGGSLGSAIEYLRYEAWQFGREVFIAVNPEIPVSLPQ